MKKIILLCAVVMAVSEGLCSDEELSVPNSERYASIEEENQGLMEINKENGRKLEEERMKNKELRKKVAELEQQAREAGIPEEIIYPNDDLNK